MRRYIPPHAILIPETATRVFQGKIFEVFQWEQELFDKNTAIFEGLRRPDSVDCIAIRDGKIVVLEQKQPHVGFFYSFPGGRNDVAHEDELQAVQREVLEEAGMIFANWKLISVIQPQEKIEQFVYTFLATGFIEERSQTLDAGEEITITLKTFEEVKKLGMTPEARYLGRDILRDIHSLAELENIPALYCYT